MSDNRIVRLGLSGIGGTAAEVIELTNTEVVDATEAGPLRLLANGSIKISSICHDWSGNLYATDSSNHCVIKISEGGYVSLVAGKPGSSGNNGTLMNVDALAARFNQPEGICCDKSGTLFVCDTFNHQIKSIKGGKVNTIAGSAGLNGLVDGSGLDARFNRPMDVCVDRAGILYVADSQNHAVRKIDNNGTVLTVAGNGAPGNLNNVQADNHTSIFNTPRNISVDREGSVYVIDYNNDIIKKITPNGWVYRFSGSGNTGRSLGTTDPKAWTCSYNQLYDIDPDESGNMYVLDYNGVTGSRILKLDYNGNPSEVADLNGSSYNSLYAMCVSPAQKLFIAFNSNIQ